MKPNNLVACQKKAKFDRKPHEEEEVVHLNIKSIHFSQSSFIYPPRCYNQEGTQEQVVFNTRVQLFAQEVSYIGGLEASGQISAKAAYKQIKANWKQLKKFKKQLKWSNSLGNLISYPAGKKG